LASVERAASSSSENAAVPESPGVVLVRRRWAGGVFGRLWWATGISASGDGLVAVAVPLMAVTLTSNPLVIAGLTAANRASAAVAALPGGLVADRWDRRNLMVACNLVAGIVLMALVGTIALHAAELVMLYVVAAVLAACDVTYTLAVQASLPDVVRSDQLAAANGRLIAVEGAGEQFVGPACGGLLFSVARWVPFLADGVSFFISALFVSTGLPSSRQRERQAEVPAGPGPRAGDARAPVVGPAGDGPPPEAVVADGPGSGEAGAEAGRQETPAGSARRSAVWTAWVADFRQGLRVFRKDSALKLLAAIAASTAFCQSMVFAILVLYGKQVLHLSSTGYGLFLAFASVIGVTGAFYAGPLQRRFGAGMLIIGGTALAMLSYIGLAFTSSAVLAVFVFGLQEVGVVVVNVGSVTSRQHLIPRNLYGRVGSVHRLAVTCAGVAGALVAGLVASASSVPVTMLSAGLLMVFVLVAFGPALLRRLPVASAK